MPRKYPDFHVNHFGQELRKGDTVVGVSTTSANWNADRRLLIGTVDSFTMERVRVAVNTTRQRLNRNTNKYETERVVLLLVIKPEYLFAPAKPWTMPEEPYGV